MAFTDLPRMFDSVAGELIYKIEGLDASGYTDVRLIDARSDRTLALKRFYRTATAEVNAAPAARSVIRFSPPAGPSGICPVPERTALIAAEADGERTPVRLFTAGRGLPPLPSVPTTLPPRRTLARGEYDELTLLVPDNCLVELTRRFGDGESFWEAFQLLPVTRTEPAAFVVHADKYEPDTVGLDLVIRSGDEPIRTFAYDFVSRPAGARRVAWRSSLGSIEHFTFPVEEELSQTVPATDGAASREALLAERTRTLTLRSGYEPREVIAALAEIVRSPDVWIATGAGYVRVVPEGGTHGLRGCTGPTQLEIRLRIPESCDL